MRCRSLVGVFFGLLLTPTALSAGIQLKAIRFPGSLTGTNGPTASPDQAPLSQVIVFEFTGKPKLPAGVAEGLRIRVDPSNTLGQPPYGLAFGNYKVHGNKVIFTPRLPTVPLTSSFTATTDISGNDGLPGLLPNTTYRIEVTVGTVNSIRNLTGIKPGVGLPVTFKTTNVPQQYFSNASLAAPKVKLKKLRPAAGSSGIHPAVFQDPAGLFAQIPENRRPPFRIVFKRPVQSSAANYQSGYIRLKAVLSPEGVPEDLPVSATALLTLNQPKRAEVLLYPSGFLPLGHTLVLELSDRFEALSGANGDDDGDETFTELARYKVAVDPQPGTALDDFIFEDFDDTVHQDPVLANVADQQASWDAGDSDTLRASWGFGGDGSLGRFEPPTNPDMIITLDTDFQTFPLFSGATPDVRAGTVIRGGVFHFTDFHITQNVTLLARGSNPLVITATGDVLIEGKIDLRGGDGTRDDTFDSAITALPGGSPGVGAGKGGDSHPLYSPPGATKITFLQTPQFGQTGFGPGNHGPGGGGGGQCGCTLPFPNLVASCLNWSGNDNGSRGSGGGGGSNAPFIPSPQGPEPLIPVSGRRGAVGAGNHLPVQFNAADPLPPPPAYYDAQPGNPTNAVARISQQMTFKEAYLAGLIYDDNAPMNLDNPSNPWPRITKVTLFGEPGPAVFPDEDMTNNFIGPGGEINVLQGSQGGGGAGSLTEGLTWECKELVFDVWGLPLTLLDSRGGSGGGGGGAILIQALGTITFAGTQAMIMASAGKGAGGENTGKSNRGGGGGGGAGGTVILQAGVNVFLDDSSLPSGVIDVSGGCGDLAEIINSSNGRGVSGGDARVLQFGDGGPGGPGLVQIHIPQGAQNHVNASRTLALMSLDMYDMRCNQVTSAVPLVNMSLTPTPLTPRSTARSVWYDLGAVTSEFRPPIVTTAGTLNGPIFGVPGVGPFFRGTDTSTGRVMTDALGNVLTPFTNDIEVDAPDLLRSDYIPNGVEYPYSQSVEVWFEGADEDVANPGSPDLTTSTGFVSDTTLLNGRRFVRYEIRFDIATDPGLPASPATPRQEVRKLRVPFKY